MNTVIPFEKNMSTIAMIFGNGVHNIPQCVPKWWHLTTAFTAASIVCCLLFSLLH